jgi:putative drug exporter of the RND superfamily
VNWLAGLVTCLRSRSVAFGLWLALAVVSVPLASKLPEVTIDSTSRFISPDAEAQQVAGILRDRFEGGDRSPVVVGYQREGGLTEEDKDAILEQAGELAKVELASPGLVPFGPEAGPGLVSEGGDTALSVVPLENADQREVRTSIDELREIAAKSPDGVTTFVTGNPALESDVQETREEADPILFGVTALLVLTLLIAIYRSPVVAFVPLITVGVAYNVASGLLYLLAKAGMTVSATSVSLLLVLMFGAATDYCLLLVARYVVALRQHEDQDEAMRFTVPRAAPAIIASGLTVIVALLTLKLASMELISSLGPVNAIGLAVGLVASLTLLPALMTVLGRKAFWPSGESVAYKRPRTVAAGALPELPKLTSTQQHPAVREREGVWQKVGVNVLRRPMVALVGMLAFLAVGAALGLTQLKTSANPGTEILTDTDSKRGLEILGESFPPGAGAPATVLVSREGGRVSEQDVAAAQAVLKEVPNVGQIGPVAARARDGSAAAFNVVAPDDPNSNASLDRVAVMRERLDDLPRGVEGLLGGPPAVSYDYREGTRSDFKLVVPVVLGTILLILCVLLRAIVAPVYLIASVLASFFGILGFSIIGLDLLFGIDDLNAVYPVFAFIFLVALGVDYNIFLMDRVREESAEHGTREGALRALVATGPVITSAGLILAGTFGALVTVPIGTLRSLGFTVAVGVLIDTFLVRTLLVPAIIALVGDASWWPSKLSRRKTPTPTMHGGTHVSPAARGGS